jgi:hypothetical protein
MHFNRLSAFTLGVIITAASVGAVSFANAAGDTTLKACANKTSGAMRYISKGSCKKTEKLLSWSQMGPQGLPGVAGADGTNGTEGTKGATGSNGQNLYLLNAEGKTLGQITSADSGNATVLIDNNLWTLNTQNPFVSSTAEVGGYFKDASCTIPYGGGYASVGVNANSQSISINYGDRSVYDASLKIYKFTGKGLTYSSQTNVYVKSSSCLALTSAQKLSRDSSLQTLWELSEISVRPDFSWPMTVVAK